MSLLALNLQVAEAALCAATLPSFPEFMMPNPMRSLIRAPQRILSVCATFLVTWIRKVSPRRLKYPVDPAPIHF